mgnify:CR=1 FL=1
MYQEIAHVTYNHEFFSGGTPFEMNVFAMGFTTKILDALDWKLMPSSAGFSLIWNSDRLSKKEINKYFCDDNLVFYLRPVDPTNFHLVTQGINITCRHTKTVLFDNEIKNTNVESLCFYLFNWYDDRDQLTGTSFSVDTLRHIESLSQLKSLNLVDINDYYTNMDDQVLALFNRVRRISSIILNVPISSLLSSDKVINKVLYFNSNRYKVKYYLMKYTPSERLSVKLNDVKFNSNIETLENGRTVQTFTSLKSMTMKDTLENYASLVEEKYGRENILIDSLPLPNPGNYVRQYDANDNAIILAESFIN